MTHTINAAEERYLRRTEVERVTGLSRSTIYQMMSRGEFPRPIKLGKRAVGWQQSAIVAWMTSRVEATGTACPSAKTPSQ